MNNKLPRGGAIALFISAMGLALAVPAEPARGADLDHGRALAEMHCSRCHAVGNEGESLMEGAPPLRDLKLRYPVEDLAEALAEGMATGHPQMPVFTFSTKDIDDLLAYLDGLE